MWLVREREREEELQRQKEELKRQNEEIKRRNEEIRRRNKEIRKNNAKLKRQNKGELIIATEEEIIEEPEEEEDEDTYAIPKDKISFWNRLYYSKMFRGVIIILAAAIIIPVFIVLFLDMSNPEFDSTHTCSIEPGYQIPCGKQNTTFEECSTLKCCFNETNFSCFHKLMSYYQYTQTEEDSTSNLYQPMEEKTPFGINNTEVYLSVRKENTYTLEISLSTKPDDEKIDKDDVENPEYEFEIFKHVLAVEVNRTKSNEKGNKIKGNGRLLSTTRGPTIISDRYWEWTVDLYAEHLFGMDQLHFPDNQTTVKVIYKNTTDHSSLARFMSYSSGKYHGLEVVHTGPLEVTVTEAKLLILRTFSGTKLTLRLMTGPTPVDVVRQLRNNEQWTPVPYWMLGVHVCRESNVTNIDKILKEFNSFDSSIPYDSDCIHENLFSLSTNKGNTKVDAAVVALKTKKKFLMSLSPQVLYENKPGSNYKKAELLNILYTQHNQVLKGKYLKKSVAYPDYRSPKAQKWFKDIYDAELAHLKPDGLILRSNWPVNDNYKMENSWKFQYMPETVSQALSKTLPWDSLNSESIQHIDVHNSYGLDYTNVVASQTKANIILSSAFTHGSHYPAHIQNVDATWVNFKEMLRKTLSHSIFGGQLFSVPVCGDTKKFDKEINQGVCVRWYLTAATMPLFRLSSDLPRRDPSVYKDVKYVQNIMLEAIEIRYTLLPYYYTVMSENLPMVRPLFFNFPDNEKTFELDEQYMIGESLLVAQPSLFPTPNIQVFLPEIPGGWYEFWGGKHFFQNGWVVLPLIESDLITFIAAGRLVPIQDGIRNSAEETKKNPLKLIIALHCTTKDQQETCRAQGTLFSADSITVEFQVENKNLVVLNAEQCQQGKVADFTISKFRVYKNDEMFLKTLNDVLKFCVKRNANLLLPDVIPTA